MRSRRTVALWAAAIGYAVAIFVLSSFPVLGPAQETLALVGDKALHAAEYAGFASLLALAIATTPSATIRSWTALIALLGAVVYAASDELHQTFVTGRSGDLMDLVADAAGASVAVIVYQAWRWRASRAAPVSETSPR